MVGDGSKPMGAPQVNEDEDLYYDAYSEEDLINLMSDPNPNLMDLPPFTQDPLLPSTGLLQEPSLISLPKRDDTIKEYLESLKLNDDSLPLDTSDDILSDDINNYIDYAVPGEIGNDNVGESGILEASTHVFVENALNFETGGTSTMPVPVITPTLPTISQGVFLCTYCNLLRQLVHATGQEMMRLDLYGGIGYFCHAIIETRRFDGFNELRYQTCHLMDVKMADVKKFIEDYCAARAAGGFVIIQDSNADFYQAMNACTTNSQSLASTLATRDDIPVSLAMPPAVKVKGKPRRQTNLSAQRKRTRKLTVKDMSELFELPIEQAARRLRICTTAVKKICRRGEVYRWPQRKLKSLREKVAAQKSVVSKSTDARVRAQAEEKMENFEKQIDAIYSKAR
ncbi:RWP-RK domain protein [Hirschfeldia incana]|nr:RWP-RK domain protein [Hirschfeldia incana]